MHDILAWVPWGELCSVGLPSKGLRPSSLDFSPNACQGIWAEAQTTLLAVLWRAVREPLQSYSTLQRFSSRKGVSLVGERTWKSVLRVARRSRRTDFQVRSPATTRRRTFGDAPSKTAPSPLLSIFHCEAAGVWRKMRARLFRPRTRTRELTTEDADTVTVQR